MVHLKIKRLDKEIAAPNYAKDGDAAFDLRSTHDVLIKAGEKTLVKTGLCVAIPKGYVGLIWDRSGLAAKNGLTCLGGVIDAGYRGEIGVVLCNLGTEDFKVERSMRIAQMLIQPVHQATIEEVEELEETQRGSTGFGSSGLH
ncbi:dUTP diphosphatase [Candidatus Woesearchaeota archaeon]|nr:dUTP diphosphatase [Candidatus Woesearchaeota archaeon]